ncbi:group-specific protein [Streptomyces nigrescens]
MGRRLRLVRQVRFAPTADGAAVLGPSGTLALRGAFVHAWLEQLRPLLDGVQDVGPALDRLPAGHRAVGLRLLDTLRRQGFVREPGDELPHGLDDDELRRHAHEIAYIGHWLDSPEHRFERYRTAQVLLLGDGPLRAATEHALLSCGLRQVCALEARPPYEELHAAARRADAVVYAGDGTTPGSASAVAAAEQACHDRPLFRALARHGDCWLLPHSGSPRWAEVRHRVATGPAPDGAELGARQLGARQPGVAAAALVGGRLALSVFRLLTGVPDESAADEGAAGESAADEGPVRECLRIDLGTLAAHRHRVLPRPDGAPVRGAAGTEPEGAAAEFGRRMASLREGPPVPADELTGRLAACADDLTGPWGEPTTVHGDQIPLTVARCAVAGDVVVGASLDPRAARAVALRRAAAAHAVRVAREAWGAPETPEAVHVFAARLTDGRTERLPAPSAPDRSSGTHRSGLLVAEGTVCAESWDAAVEEALYDAVRELVRRRMAVASVPYPRLAPDALAADSEAVRHWRLLCALGPAPEVRDVSRGAGAPLIALAAEGEPGALGCAATAAGAFTAAARDLLLDRQQGRPRPADAPAGALAAPAPVTDAVPGPLPGATAGERVTRLAGHLDRQGCLGYVMPLVHDTAFHTLAPYVARVALHEPR